ncbi:family 1 glycosylhydrolase [Isobaculum melis]|uniref:Glycosyl hydrolase family 1 n=1 Tax=Isobaculum melis TaxID=142588 RepID=A0A1H9PRL0_9LACT|nr:family 1 glycosylhydrolase [Isobaculum melis]SER50740.1 Glycosyl hydrolase family 1 [Isobaculum melis]
MTNFPNLYVKKGDLYVFLSVFKTKYAISYLQSEEDKKILKEGKVDFYSFSYDSTICTTIDKNAEKSGKGNLQLGVVNPHLEYTEWGWSKDGLGLRYYLNERYGRYEMPNLKNE